MPFFSPLSLNKKSILYFISPIYSSNDIQLKMFVSVVVKYILYNNNAQLERAERGKRVVRSAWSC